MVGNVSDSLRDTKMIAKKAASKPVIPGGSMSENRNAVELHGCIVCARLFNILVVYSPDNSLVGCTVTSPDGHIVPDRHQPLVARNTHTAKEVETAYKRWQSVKVKESDDEREED
jgi:hypothetical protein